ncbi:sugar phosphate isomerase/epimerase family protein [Segetibacter koreensis]|uniref:sugar phosphate isomerase/epimerase family protein n=1 Tax=Segetibacter koreensis TaxID=398037 RepID=UPI0003748997|nr:sugar phosphate isomerase/epimerase family protein [Segetibacter koreensis]
MKKYDRRDFLQNIGGLLALAFAASAFDFKKNKPLLSFSTLGCPDWSFEKIVNFAKENGYDGLEIRTIQRQMDLPKCAEFSTLQKIAETRKFVKDKGIKIVDLGASASLHHSNSIERKKNLDEAKQFIDLAEQLKCPYIRVFPNDFPPDQDRNATIDLISKGLLELGDYAKGSEVTVLLESHGQVVKSNDLETIMKAAEHEHVGLIWDIVNMWVVTKEPPAEVYQKLRKYIRHTHIKDVNIVDGKEHYTLLGKGESPVFEGIDALNNGGYTGYFSFEWEKLWHPEIAEPEIALADFPKTMEEHFKKMKNS